MQLSVNYGICGGRCRGSSDAFGYLEHAVDAGYDNAPFMRTDEALKSLRNDPRFDKLLAREMAASRQPVPVSR
jgi:eukaryotic-like serine/threonine-protein kinase